MNIRLKTLFFTIIIPILINCIFNQNYLFAGYYDDGRKYYIYKQFDKAREMFLKRIEAGEHGDSYYFLGEIEKLSGNYSEAEDYFKKATEISTTTIKYRKNAFWNLIVFSEQRGEYDNVVLLCKEMWYAIHDDSAKSKIETLINKFLWSDNEEAVEKYKTGMELKSKGNVEEAIISFREALNTDYSFLAAKFEIGMYYYKHNDFDNASWYLEDIAKRIPFYAEVQLLLGNIQYNKKYYSSAIYYFEKGLEYGILNSSTEYNILINTGTCYYHLGNYDKALEHIEKALSYNSKSIKSHLLLSAIFIKQNNYDEALKILHKAEKINPGDTSVLFQIGSIYYKKDDGRYLSYFDRLYNNLKNDDEKTKFRKIMPILARGNFGKNNFRKTIEVISSMPKEMIDYDMRLILAKSLFNLKEYDKAIDEFEKISLNTENELILCKAYARSGREDQARQLLSRFQYNETIMKEARSDAYLARILEKIDRERKEKELEKQRKQEELKRQEEQKRQEEERNRQKEIEKKSSPENQDTVTGDKTSRNNPASESGKDINIEDTPDIVE